MTYLKDPDALLPYAVDWTAFMATVPGDVIATAEVIAPPGLHVEDEGITAGVHTMLLGGGDPGRRYRVTSRITTVAGLVNDASFTVYVQEA